MAKFTIYPVRLGHSEISANFVEFRSKAEGKTWFSHGCFAAKNNETGEVTLLDTGSAHYTHVEKYGTPYTTNVEKGPTLVEALENLGIKVSDVKRICITHLHHDHAANLWYFPKTVPIYVQRAETANAASPYNPQKWDYTVIDNPVCPYWKEHVNQFVTVDGDFEIEPGLKLLFTPGHTFGSQSIMVDTEEGPYIYVGDQYYCKKNYTDAVIHTNYASMRDWYESHAKIMATGAKIICLHEKASFEVKKFG